MVRIYSAVLGAGLIILWLAELSVNVAPWLTWLDLVAAVCAFVVAAGLTDKAPRNARVGAPIALSLGLFVLWIIALAGGYAPAWQVWWNFAFACAFLVMGLAALSPSTRAWGGDFRYRDEYGANGWRSYDRGQPYYGGPFLPTRGYSDFYDRPQSPPAARGPRGYRRSDARIEEDVNDTLSDQWNVDASDVQVQVKDAEVILRGSVKSRRERRVVEDIVESVRGVRDIRNELEVRSGEGKAPIRAA